MGRATKSSRMSPGQGKIFFFHSLKAPFLKGTGAARAQAVEGDIDMIFREGETLGNVGHAVKIPVAADENPALGLREGGEKVVDSGHQLPAVQSYLRGVPVGDDVLKLLKNRLRSSAAPLLRGRRCAAGSGPGSG